MAASGSSLASLASVMTRMPQVLINVPDVDKARAHSDEAVLAAIAEEESALDGKGRVLLRPSGTEPLVRVMVEAETHERAQQSAERLAKVIDIGAVAALMVLDEVFGWRGREVRWTRFGQGPDVVFCHGTPWSSYLWEPFATALSRTSPCICGTCPASDSPPSGLSTRSRSTSKERNARPRLVVGADSSAHRRPRHRRRRRPARAAAARDPVRLDGARRRRGGGAVGVRVLPARQ